MKLDVDPETVFLDAAIERALRGISKDDLLTFRAALEFYPERVVKKVDDVLEAFRRNAAWDS